MKLLKRLSCFVVATCLAISCASCSGNDTTWAFEYGNTTIGSGLYIGFSMSAYIEATYSVMDYTQDVLTQYVEDVPAKQWIINRTEELSNRYVVIENEFERLGLELSAEAIQNVDDELKVTWNSSGEIYEANGVGRNSYRLILENYQKEQALFLAYYGEGGTDELSEEDMFEYFKSEYAIINAMALPKEFSSESFEFDENGEVIDLGFGEEDLIFDKAQAFVDRINAGEPFNLMVAEYTEEFEAELAAAEAEEEDEDGFVVEYIDAEDAEEYKANLAESSDEYTQAEVDEEGETTLDEEDDTTLDEEDETTLDEEDETALDEEDETTLDEEEETTLDEEYETALDEENDTALSEEDDIQIEYEYENDEDTKFPIARSSTSPSEEFVNQVFQLPTNGKAAVIEETAYYYIIVRYEVDDQDAAFDEYKESLLYEMRNEDFTLLIEDLVESMTPTSTNNASITRYDPKNIKVYG